MQNRRGDGAPAKSASASLAVRRDGALSARNLLGVVVVGEITALARLGVGTADALPRLQALQISVGIVARAFAVLGFRALLFSFGERLLLLHLALAEFGVTLRKRFLL